MTAIPMVLDQRTEEWLKFRAKGGQGNPYLCAIGASEVPIVMGMSPYRSARDLWAEKSGLRPPQPDNRPMADGRAAEWDLLNAYEAMTRTTIVRGPVFYCEELPWMVASLDGIWSDFKVGVEAKLCDRARFNEAMTGIIREDWEAQAQAQMAVLDGMNMVHFVVANLGDWRAGEPEVVVVPVPRDDKKIEAIREVVKLFCQSVTDGREWTDFSVKPAEPVAVEVSTPIQVVVAEDPDRTVRLARPGMALAMVQVPSLGPVGPMQLIPDEVVRERDRIVASATACVVTDMTTADKAGLMQQEITRIEKRADTQRKALTAPWRQTTELINDAVKDFLAPLSAAKDHLSKQITAYRVKLDAEREAAERARRQAEVDAARAAASLRKAGVAQDKIDAVVQAAVGGVQIPEKPVIAGVSTVYQVAFDVEDLLSVNRNFLTVDHGAVRQYLKERWNDCGKEQGRFDEWLATDEAKEMLRGLRVWVEATTKGR